MNLFSQLRAHAQVQPEAVAIYSRERITTYRKLWSRIERATARLQEEWQIREGDRIAYLGHGHPDAIVLYVALARSGGLLVPINFSIPAVIETMLRKSDVRMLIHDDGRPLNAMHIGVPAKPLSELISTPCPCQPAHIQEDTGKPALLMAGLKDDGGFIGKPYDMERLLGSAPATTKLPGASLIDNNLFNESIFGPVALRTLFEGNMLFWS